jgi:hypothetical protein
VDAGAYGICVYQNGLVAVSVTLEIGPVAELAAKTGMKNPATVTVAGHAALCGAETGKYSQAGTFQLAAQIKGGDWIAVAGGGSCAVDGSFAKAVFGNL